MDQVDGDQVGRGRDYFDTLCLTNPDIGEMTVTRGNEIDGRRLYAVSFFPMNLILVSVVLNGGINENTFLEAAIGGVLGIFGVGIAGGVSRGLASGIGQKLIIGAKNSKVLGSVLRGGQKLVSKMPAPIQKMFTRGGFIGAVEGAGTSVADDILHGRKINWKNAALAGVFGAGAVAVVHFAQPVVNKAVASMEPVLAKTPIVKNFITKVDDCVAARQTGGYHAFFLAVKPGCIDTGITDLLKVT